MRNLLNTLSPAPQTSFSNFTTKSKRSVESASDELITMDFFKPSLPIIC